MTFMEDDPQSADFWDILGGYVEVVHATVSYFKGKLGALYYKCMEGVT